MASWDTYIYKDGATATFTYGDGYVYPITYPPTNGSVETISDEDNYPALYAKTVVDKIFSDAGYNYTNDSFFNTDRFKRLIIPWTNQGLEVDETTAANYLFKAQQNAGVTGATYVQGDQLLFTNEISDPGKRATGGQWTAGRAAPPRDRGADAADPRPLGRRGGRDRPARPAWSGRGLSPGRWEHPGSPVRGR